MLQYDKIPSLQRNSSRRGIRRIAIFNPMTEQRFIQQNRVKWQEFENIVAASKKADPDRLSELYIEVIDDLSYARTHYPRSKVVTYLNQIATKAHKMIYGTRRETWQRIIRLFKEDVPRVAQRESHYAVWSTIIFVGAIALGWLSTAIEPEFPRAVMGEEYVNQTLENIDSGDPMAVYDSMQRGSMFAHIAVNNVRVAFLMFIVGLAGGLPTVLLLLYNGVMVGAFLSFFAQRDLFNIAFTTIFLHGAIELFAIVIAGACGLMIGAKWLFPGTFPRMYRLINSAKESLVIMAGVIPFIITAALIESFVTRLYQDMPGILRIIIVISTFAVMFWYFFLKSSKTEIDGAQ